MMGCGLCTEWLRETEWPSQMAECMYIPTPLTFAPEMIIIQRTFADHIPGWVNMISKVGDDWDACRSTLEGHSGSVNAAAFSPDGQLVASASADSTVWLWETATGSHFSTLDGMRHLERWSRCNGKQVTQGLGLRR